MNGIEILATEQVATEYSFNWLTFGITFGIMVLVMFLYGLFDSATEISELWIPVVIGMIFGVILGGIFGFTSSTPTKYETQYEVLISDETSINEFLEEYEIIDQNGKIYTIREK